MARVDGGKGRHEEQGRKEGRKRKTEIEEERQEVGRKGETKRDSGESEVCRGV